MTRTFCLILALSMPLPASAHAQKPTIFDFFAEEALYAHIITASRLPLSIRQSPATVYILTNQDIITSGAKTLWDVLRKVPGVEVMATRTAYGEVSIRGLNKIFSNRTLILLDGRTVINGPFDSIFWEGVPVTLSEIDRIEIVLGPASALYGANAVNGVINIITKSPAQMQGKQVIYTIGEYNTQRAQVNYAQQKGNTGFKTSASAHTTNQFEKSDQRATQVIQANALMTWHPSAKTHVSFSGGLIDYETQFSAGMIGVGIAKGRTGFLRADMKKSNTTFRTFWTRRTPTLHAEDALEDLTLKIDLADMHLSHRFSLFATHQTSVGIHYQHTIFRALATSRKTDRTNEMGLFFEHAWHPVDYFTVVISNRIGYHNASGWEFSPRASLVVSPSQRHVFRVSGGQSFRNPTPTEHFLTFVRNIKSPLPFPLSIEVNGDPNLHPERMVQYEVSHEGRFGRIQTKTTAFYYHLHNIITIGDPQIVPELLPEVRIRTAYTNLNGSIQNYGGEMGISFEMSKNLSLFANHAYQRHSKKGSVVFEVGNQPSAHKTNLGIRIKAHHWTGNVWLHRISDSFWSDVSATDLRVQIGKVPAYTLLNARLSYTFKGPLKGLEISTEAFNLTDQKHYQLLPAKSSAAPGQNGEQMRRRITATISYRF